MEWADKSKKVYTKFCSRSNKSTFIFTPEMADQILSDLKLTDVHTSEPQPDSESSGYMIARSCVSLYGVDRCGYTEEDSEDCVNAVMREMDADTITDSTRFIIENWEEAVMVQKEYNDFYMDGCGDSCNVFKDSAEDFAETMVWWEIHKILSTEYFYDKDGYKPDGYDVDGYDKHGFDRDGFDEDGYDKHGFDMNNNDRTGTNKEFYDTDYDEDEEECPSKPKERER